MIKEYPIFNVVPNRKPKKAPQPIFKASDGFFPAKINSPIKAPKKGPINIPRGGKNNIPNNSPTKEPVVAYLVPPSFFAPQAGT